MSLCRYLHKLFWRGCNLDTELRKASMIAGHELRALGWQVAALNTALSTTRSIKLKSNKKIYCTNHACSESRAVKFPVCIRFVREVKITGVATEGWTQTSVCRPNQSYLYPKECQQQLKQLGPRSGKLQSKIKIKLGSHDFAPSKHRLD